MLLLPYQNAGVSIMLLAEDFMTKDLLIGVIFFSECIKMWRTTEMAAILLSIFDEEERDSDDDLNKKGRHTIRGMPGCGKKSSPEGN